MAILALFVPRLKRWRRSFVASVCLAVVVSVLFPTLLAAGETSAGTFGAPFLRIPAGARLTASPDIVAGMQPDASLVFSNPAFATDIGYSEVFFSTSNWLDGMRYSAASGVLPLPGRAITLSLGTSLLYSGGLKGYDETLAVVREEDYFDLSVRTAVSKRFDSLGLSVGAGVTYIRQHIYPQDGDGFAFAVGASYRLGRNLIHAAAKDVGGSVSFPGADYDISAQTMFGVGRTFGLRYGHVNAGAQVVFSKASRNRIQLGFDYNLNQYFSLRTALPDALNEVGEDYPFSAGFGVRYGQIGVEYAYTPREYFANTHTFSLVFSVGKRGAGILNENVDPPSTEAVAPRQDASPATPAGEAKADAARAVEAPAPSPATGKAAASTGTSRFYVIIAGIHGSLEGAKAEVKALNVQGVRAKIESMNSKFRVIVGRYQDQKKANEALKKFRQAGHLFILVDDSS